MGQRLYVGNLPYRTTDEELSDLFGRAGIVENVQVMRDLTTGRARGFAFVQMGSDEDAQRAIAEFHQYQLDGRALIVNEARPKPVQTGPRSSWGDGELSRGGRREPRW